MQKQVPPLRLLRCAPVGMTRVSGLLRSTSVGITRLMSDGLDSKRAGRRPAGLHVGEIERVELRPENVALVAQRLHGKFLLDPSLGVLTDIIDGEGGVFRSLRQARLEIVQAAREPR